MKILKRVSFFFCVCIILLMVFHPQVYDKIFLFEKHHPNYWRNLSNPTVYTVDEKIDKTYGSPVNLAFKLENDVFPDSLQVQNLPDGSMRISGEYHGPDLYYVITSDDMFLPIGMYNFSCGEGVIDWNTFEFYFEVYYPDGTHQALANLPETNSLEIDQIYFASMDICICFKDGFYADNLVLSPMITRLEADGFADMLEEGKTDEIAVYEANPEELDEEDWKIFERNVSSRYNKYLWNSVIFPDQTGVQYYQDGTKRSGRIDRFGRVQ